MIATTAGVFIASLLGSVHCAGMCGGFVCFYTGASRGADASALRAHFMYHAGRLASYLTLGAMAGVIGSNVAHAGALVGINRAAAMVAGVLMIGWAVSTIAAQRGLSIGRFSVGSPAAPLAWQKALGRVLTAVRDQPMSVRAGLTGLLTTLLPCGWLYVFVAAAGGTGRVSTAMTTMLVFWLGSVPALMAVGIGAQRLLAPFRRRLPAFSAVVVLIMGLLSISGHLTAAAEHAVHVGSAHMSSTPAAMISEAPVHVH